MDPIFPQLIPIMLPDRIGFKELLRGDRRHSALIKATNELNLDIYTTPYIEPEIIKNADTDKGSWKLRQPIFKDIVKTEENVINTIVKNFAHPYYKRITAIDRTKGVVYKLYSTEHQRNYALQQQGDDWGNMVKQLCECNDNVAKIIEWLPNISKNLHGAMFEYIPGQTVDDMYCEVGKKLDTGHPDVVSGKLKPYWGTISCVNVHDYYKIKRKVTDMFVKLCITTSKINLQQWQYQQTENEPDWTEKWSHDDNRRILNFDDWRLQNIMITPDGEWKFIKLDRLVMTDPTNATERFVADMRNQTNITMDVKSIMKKYENTLV